MEAKRNRNIAMTFAWILLILVLATTFLVSGMLAKFATGGQSREMSRVAKFAVSGSGFTQTVNLGVTMKPGDQSAKSFTVTNNSEVTVEYTVTIRNTTNNLPLKLLVNGEEETNLVKFAEAEGYCYTATLAPNSTETNNFEFTLSWPVDTSKTPATNDIFYSGQLDNVAVTVSAAQID